VRLQVVAICLAAGVMLGTFGLHPERSVAAPAGPSCGEQNVATGQGITVRILFARNGAVQRYVVDDPTRNQEADNDVILALQKQYGPEAQDTPPLRIVAYKHAYGGLMIPVRGIDSCGRTLSFQ
jgi:hypothetical protein